MTALDQLVKNLPQLVTRYNINKYIHRYKLDINSLYFSIFHVCIIVYLYKLKKKNICISGTTFAKIIVIPNIHLLYFLRIVYNVVTKSMILVGIYIYLPKKHT